MTNIIFVFVLFKMVMRFILHDRRITKLEIINEMKKEGAN